MKTTNFTSLNISYSNEVQNLRTEINILDDKIVSLLKERLQLVHEVREFKKIEGLPFHCPDREEVVLSNITMGSEGLEKEYLSQIYKTLLETTRTVADQKLNN